MSNRDHDRPRHYLPYPASASLLDRHQAVWLAGSVPAKPGARFRGRNVASRLLRWSRVCEVVAAEPGRAFSFRTFPTATKPDSTVWTYEFEPADGGTDVTES